MSKKTSSAIVLAEFGGLPLSFSWWKQVLGYHDRLVKLSADANGQDRLLVQAFKSSMMLSTHTQSNSWCCNLLLWLGKKPMYQHSLPKLDQRLRTSKLLAHVEGLQLKQIGDGTSSTMRTYRNLKVGYDREHDLNTMKSQRMRALLSRFRCGQHGLEVQLGRQAPVYVAFADRTGRCCTTGEVEDENHFLL